jgi:cytochrome c553
VNPFARLRPWLLIAATAASTPLCAKEKPVEPPPAALHAQLAQIDRDAARLPAALARGEKGAAVCRHCHGVGGNSVRAEVPNLAGQNPDYLLEQMNKFVHGQRKSSAFMSGMIKALSPDERIDIALFLSRQPVLKKPAGIDAHGVAGGKLYAKLCVGCHGPSATGAHKIPRLAGQQVQYLEDSLKRYRDGGGERVDPRMAAYTRNLENSDIEALAAYLSAL